MLDRWFASPDLLLATLAAPAATVFFLYAFLRRRRGLARLGDGLLLRKAILLRPRVRRWRNLCVVLGISLLAVACARPQWGHDPTPQQRTGRDVILVLDLSRSMRAEQPSRVELAVRALRDLADAFELDGGNRVALVLFAAKAELLFPFTQDYDHLRHVLKQIEDDDYPALSADDLVSGTRIGAALKRAADLCEPQRASRPVALLLSDGDDPAADDEWLEGIAEAKKRRLRVHVVGIGDPQDAHTIPAGKDRLEYGGQPVRTKLNEERLEEIAARTGGTYLPARTMALPLGAYVRYLLDADALREDDQTDAGLPVYQQRYPWFLGPAVILFMLTMLLGEGPASAWKWPWGFPMQRTSQRETTARVASPFARLPTLFVVVGAFISISASAAPSVESLLRLGNEAFERQDYDAAVNFYEQAEPLALDPGLISFNKAAAYYRLGKFRDAIECCRRSLEDDQSPTPRRARASFGLGNALLQQGLDDPTVLAQAAAAYRACLQQASMPADLRRDARHNLELAQMLWLRALAKQKNSGANDNDPRSDQTPPENKDGTNAAAEQGDGDEATTPVDPKNGPKKGAAARAPRPKKSANLTSGTVQVLPDQDPVRPLSAEDTLATLEREAQRIAHLRRQQRHPDGPASLTTKDW